MKQEYKDIKEWLKEQIGEIDIADYFYEGLQEEQESQMSYSIKINIGTKESPNYVLFEELDTYLKQ